MRRNEFYLEGVLVKDAGVRYTSEGAVTLSLRIEADVEFDVLWRDGGSEAERLILYLRKGVSVRIHGILRWRTWTDKTTFQERRRIELEAVRILPVGVQTEAAV